MAKKHIKSKPGLFGMVYYYDEDGNSIGKSRSGLIEGTRVYTDRNGRCAGKSRPGFLAKEVYTDSDNNCITSYDSLLGELHFKNGAPIGHSRHGLFDISYTTLETDDEYYDDETDIAEDYFEEEEPYEEYEDEEEYTSAKPSRTVSKKLIFFVMFLVLCVVSIFLCSIIKTLTLM